MITFPALAAHALAVTAVPAMLAYSTAGLLLLLDKREGSLGGQMLDNHQVSALVDLLILRELLDELNNAACASER